MILLSRLQKRKDGIFGQMTREDGAWLCDTLEHAYPFNDMTSGSLIVDYRPKVMAGSYLCMKGMHRLASQRVPFETFELTQVPGHTGILIHPGNKNADSQGCILVGDSMFISTVDSSQRLMNSKKTFDQFMVSLKEIQTFILTIQNHFSGGK